MAPEGTDERLPPSIASLQAGLLKSSIPGAQVSGATEVDNVILKRIHPILKCRYDQLQINLLALYGGRPYIEERLSRFAGEHKISWEGGTRKDGSHVTGRKEQAHCVPYAGRIAEKINQYVFAEPATRTGADPDFVANVTREGQSVHFFMRELNSYLTACDWAWIGVDMPRQAGEISMLEKEQKKVRPYWVLYSPTEVMDWCFNEVGELKWILTQKETYTNDDPLSPGKMVSKRYLWELGKCTAYWYDEVSKQVQTEVIDVTLKTSIPFILVGIPSPRPHLYDSIESINRTILDLESVSRQNYFDRCFPQMYLPASVINAMQNLLKGYSAEEMMEMVIGLNYPILLEQGDPTPGYIMPGSGDLKAPDEKVQQLKRDMFECVGMMLKTESRDAQSAEAKGWDHLDVEQVLKDRANRLQEAEKKAVEISKLWDPLFKVYTPEWPMTFNVRDFSEDMRSLIELGQVPMPAGVTKELLLKLIELMSKIGVKELTTEKLTALRKEVETFVDDNQKQLEEITRPPAPGEELEYDEDGNPVEPGKKPPGLKPGEQEERE